MLEEALNALHIKPNGVYVDATFGRGGHTAAMLQRLGPEGRLLAIDKDPDAVEVARSRFGDEPRLLVCHGSFADLHQVATRHGWLGRVDGVLLDLGVSSPQLDEARRGFSFLRDGPLDMRMDSSAGMTAAQWLAKVDENELVRVLKIYGEERFARRIARAIIAARHDAPIETTGRLAGLIAAAMPVKEKDKHPATRSFQAIRIFLNRELEDLQTCLAHILEVLGSGGRLAVISFHSLEDRIVKRFIRDQARGDEFPSDLPVTADQLAPKLRPIGKALYPSEQEIEANPRARSAVLRVAEKL